MVYIQDSLFGKTCPEPSQAIKEQTSTASCKTSSRLSTSKQRLTYLEYKSGKKLERSWQTTGVLRGEYWTRNFSEYPNDAKESTLSQILQAGVPDTYSLSPRAAQGILRRAAVKGKTLPLILERALTRQANL